MIHFRNCRNCGLCLAIAPQNLMPNGHWVIVKSHKLTHELIEAIEKCPFSCLEYETLDGLIDKATIELKKEAEE